MTEEWDDQSCLTASSSKDANCFLFCSLGFYRDMSMCLLSVILLTAIKNGSVCFYVNVKASF